MIVTTMSYQVYLARIEHDPRDNIVVGHVLGLSDRYEPEPVGR
jgi:predicted HicB family RNase H-like nuclease